MKALKSLFTNRFSICIVEVCGLKVDTVSFDQE